MKRSDFSASTIEPFNIGRSTYRLLFDFGVMLSSFLFSPNKRVLDLGAGTGWISEFLNRMGYEVYSLDIDRGMPETIRSRVSADKRINPAMIFPIIGNGIALPFPNDFFSHICCFDTLHHMDDYSRTFWELFRVLSPGGRAIFIEPGARHSHSEETIKFIQTYKKDDPTWIERDVNLKEISIISKICGFSSIVIQPTILPGLRNYSFSQWDKFRHNNLPLIKDYLSLLKDFNYNEHLSFYCEKPVMSELASRELELPMSAVENAARLSGLKIAIDLTPMLPGGENGGAKLMTLELIRALAKLLPQTKFLLLTAESSHTELDGIENQYPNIQRLCVFHSQNTPSDVPKAEFTWREKTLDILISLARMILPFSIKQRFKHWLHRGQAVSGSVTLLRENKVDLLFCPFTAPLYADAHIPIVSVIYDLQYQAYPQFFTSVELFQREEAFKTACQKADHLVTISKFVQRTVIETSDLPPHQVSAVTIGLLQTPEKSLNKTFASSLLLRYHLIQGEFLIFPANFWEHKNHSMLLTALGMYREAHPNSKLKLVCTGAPGRSANNFCNMVQRMGLTGWVIYPGFVSASEYECLLKSAFALIFPSLYEGFGIPVLEAMAAGVPVLCSNITSLPEVGGDAVLYFDPRKPADICNTLEQLVNQPDLREKLITKGLKRSLLFQGPERMANQYIAIFINTLRTYNKNDVLKFFSE